MITMHSYLLIAVAVLLLIILINYIMNLRLHRSAAQFPGPRALPMIGNSLSFIGNSSDVIDTLFKFFHEYSINMTPVRIWIGNELVIALINPKHLKIILTSPKTIEKPHMYHYVKLVLGTGLATAPGAIWRGHRKVIQPAFNTQILRSFIGIFVQKAEIMIKNMEVELQNDEFDVFEYTSQYAFNSLCETVMSTQIDMEEIEKVRFFNTVRKITNIIAHRTFNILLRPEILFKCSSYAAEYDKSLECLSTYTNKIIQMKRQQLLNPKYSGNTDCAENPQSVAKTFLDSIMKLTNIENQFTDEELRDEINTMLLGGTESTAITSSLVIFMLANFPEIQQKCYDELCEIFGDKINTETSITSDDLCRMNYLERVIKETMRLFPVLPFIARKISADHNVGKYIIPEGATIIIPILLLHRHPELWSNPLEFNPDRFLPDETANRHPYSYIPFSAGPRNCIGFQYGMMSLKTLLATILRKYILHKNSKIDVADIKFKAELLLEVVHPMNVKIMRRGHNPNKNHCN